MVLFYRKKVWFVETTFNGKKYFSEALSNESVQKLPFPARLYGRVDQIFHDWMVMEFDWFQLGVSRRVSSVLSYDTYARKCVELP